MENSPIEYSLAVLDTCYPGSLTRRDVVERVIAKEPELSVTQVQHAINDLLESRILQIRHKRLILRPRYEKLGELVRSRKIDKELLEGYLADLNEREIAVSTNISTKWVEFFLGVVAIIQIVPIVNEFAGLRAPFAGITMLMLTVICWILVFNRTYFNKHPILIPLDVQHQIKSLYSSRDYQEHSQIQTRRGLALADQTTISKDDTVLDVGCGDGRVTLSLYRNCPQVQRILGIDISPDQIAAARTNAESESATPPVYFEVRDFVSEPPQERFSVIFSNAAIHWIGSTAYRQAYLSLLPGGRLWVEQAGEGGYRALHRTASEVTQDPRFRDFFNGFDVYKTYYAPTKSELYNVLVDIGFTNITINAEDVEAGLDVYEAFAVASLHTYFDRLPSSLRPEFRAEFLQRCVTQKPKRNSVRFIITAIKRF